MPLSTPPILADSIITYGNYCGVQMITKEMAMNAYHRQVFYSATDRYKTGQRYQCRVNGKCKTWKTRPNDFSLPIKIGFRGHGYITHRNNCSWLFEDDILDTNKENSNEETS